MILVVGVLMLALCVLAFLWAFSVFRRPDRSSWARREDTGALVSLGILLLGAMGFGFLLKFGIEFRSLSFTVVDAALTAAVVVGAVVLGRRLRAIIRVHQTLAAPLPGDQSRPRRTAEPSAVRRSAAPRGRVRKAA